MRTSYLDVPRIHFKGKYRADVNSRNNCQCNFDVNREIDMGKEWNYKGSCEWELLDTYITSVIDENGEEVVDSPLLGAQILGSEESPLAKLVDFDVDHQLPTLYGFKVRIKVDGEMILKGDWKTAVLVRDMWPRVKCGEVKYYDAVAAAMSTSRIINIDCLETTGALNLCKAWKTTELAVSVSLSFFSGEVFTIGNIVGTIGVAKDGEPLNVGGDRKLESTKVPLQVCPDSDEYVEDALSVAPFAYDASRKKLVVDIGIAFPTDNNVEVINLGDLWLGILNDGVVTIFGEPLPYLDPDILNHGGVVEHSVPEELENVVENAPVVIVKEVSSDSVGDHVYPHTRLFPTLERLDSKVMVLLQESEYFIRPTEHYHTRLEYGNDDYESSCSTLLVTRFGKPAQETSVRLDTFNAIPIDGVITLDRVNKTDSSGLVSFTFQASRSIPFPRLYDHPPCARPDYCPESKLKRLLLLHSYKNQTPILYQLPIEGQVYHFCYFIDSDQDPAPSCEELFPDIMTSQVLSFRSFSTIFYDRPYTWVNHVAPIFKQVHHLHYIMRAVLDMTSYKEVTQPYNIKLIRQSLSKDINDAGYMPVSRDLSPTKIKMILEWLDRPCFSKLDCETLIDKCQSPPSQTRMVTEDEYERCGLERIQSRSHPQRFFERIFFDAKDPSFELRIQHPPRPLFGYGSEKEMAEAFFEHQLPSFSVCDVETLKSQLQLAVQLEFSTLPLYLTSLYSIMEHCNVEANNVMRNIVVQEMLHFAQAANILIAIGGRVKIDSEEVVPVYPTHLPGGVLPNLTLTLEKFTMEHVLDNFMALEVPAYTTVPKPQENWNTIGQFYDEIRKCMVSLGEDIFRDPRSEMQVEWPWETPLDVGTLFKVTDQATANSAIEQIVEQGEGASEDSPIDQSTRQYAHFFRFEEIFCENELEKTPDGEGYAYTGKPIPYNPDGVWNMKDSLAISDIEPGTVCHTQAQAFHRVYRNFLRVLQDTFDGHPERVDEAVKLMEVLKVHAKRALWAPLNSENVRPPEEGEIMCGPIWDYEWTENE